MVDKLVLLNLFLLRSFEDVFLEIFSDDQKNQTAIKTILLKIHDKYARFSSLVLYDT